MPAPLQDTARQPCHSASHAPFGRRKPVRLRRSSAEDHETLTSAVPPASRLSDVEELAGLLLELREPAAREAKGADRCKAALRRHRVLVLLQVRRFDPVVPPPRSSARVAKRRAKAGSGSGTRKGEQKGAPGRPTLFLVRCCRSGLPASRSSRGTHRLTLLLLALRVRGLGLGEEPSRLGLERRELSRRPARG